MRTYTESLDASIIRYPDIPDNALFLDIETTGLTPRSAFIYMIGLIYYKGGVPVFESITAECASDEEALLIRFTEVLNSTGFLIHYNGDRFDLPFIEARGRAYGMDIDLCGHDGIDLYKIARPLKNIFGLASCKQKDIERFLGIDREDKYSGKELIDVYKQFTDSRDDELYKLLYQHNHDDVTGMTDILPILAYRDLFDGGFDTGDIKRNTYTSMDGDDCEELIIELILNTPLPAPLSVNSSGIYLTARGSTATLKLPILNGRLKFFYDNPKEYYYLPREDMAVHKSVAQYVDKEYREQARPYNCYTAKEGTFLPEWSPVCTPVFRQEYDSAILYFELTDEFLSDSESVRRYLMSLVERMR